jgi:adenylate kinase
LLLPSRFCVLRRSKSIWHIYGSFQVREDELLTRLKRSACADDTDEVIQIRLKVYREQTAPLMSHYRKELITIDGVGAIDGAFTRVLRALRG